MFCKYCGATLPEGAEKCALCGASTAEDAEQPILPAAPDADEAEETNEAEPQPEISETTEPALPEVEDVYSFSKNDFTEDISSGTALSDAPDSTDFQVRFPERDDTQEPEPPAPRVQPVDYEDNLPDDRYVYEEYEEEPPKKKRSLKWLFIVLPILIAIGATAGGILWWYNSPMQKLTRALSAYDYSEITQILPALSEDELASVSASMQDYAETVVDRYNKGTDEYESAYELLDRLQRLLPGDDFSSFTETMKALQASKESYKNAKALQSNGEDGPAITNYQNVIHADVNYDDAQKQIENIRSTYKANVLDEAQRLANEKDFLGAQAALMNSAEILGDDADVNAKLEEIKTAELNDYVENLLTTARTLAEENDLPGAVRLLQNATKEDNRIDSQITAYRNQYKQRILDTAAGQANESRYYDAVDTLENADDILSGDDEIAAKIEEYRALYPVSLTELSPISGENCATGWVATDAAGNTYSNGLNFSLYPILATSVSTEYAPSGQYKRLTGTWVVEKDTSADFVGTVRIYVDGNLQYEVSSLSLNSPSSELNLSIADANAVRIEVTGTFASPRTVGYIYLADATFEN